MFYKKRNLLLLVNGILLSYSSLVVAKPLTIVDFRNKTITLKNRPQKIAALMPAIADAFQALGKSSSIIAAPEFTELKDHSFQKLGPYTQISAEAVYATKPDLVIASKDGNFPQLITELERLKLPVIVLDSTSLESIIKSLEIITIITESDSSKVQELRSYIDKLKNKKNHKSQKVFFQLGLMPLVTVSKKTYIGEILELLGQKNIFSETNNPYPKPAIEAVIAENPEVILICPLTKEKEEVAEALRFWNRFQNVSAIKNHKIYSLKPDLLTRPGFLLMDAIRELEAVLNP